MSSRRFQDSLKCKNNVITATVTLLGFESDDMFVFYIPALDLYAYGDDQEEAKQAVDETVNLYFEHVLEENTLEKDLKKLGWKKHRHFKSRFNPPIYNPLKIMSKKGVDSFNVMDRQLELQPC